MKKKIYSNFLFLMQSYDDLGLIPRNCANSSRTCVDKRPNNGQIEGDVRFPVQGDVTLSWARWGLEPSCA